LSNRFIDIRVIGGRAAQRKLNKLENRMQTKVVREATKRALKPVLLTALRKAPYDEGTTKKYLKIATFRGKSAGAVVQTGTARQMGVSQAGYYYPAAHEYGTREVPGTAWLRSSLKERRSQALSILKAELKKILRKGL
jgi:hypothetical protein